MVDNYDSFTYNLVQYFTELGQETVVYRNDEITPEQARTLSPDYIVIGPAPVPPLKRKGQTPSSVPLPEKFRYLACAWVTNAWGMCLVARSQEHRW